ncbi:beta-lactamase transpeptidase [Fusarium globosum]|uniref:Beta-lactamase transpeptidase n=1 Tax=Fusarium globosum TaxID=78864 RepID=A0A8H5YJJ8_9HYPO|nr:beta-lactamase transpeptidase [Fusarium globosum]
MTADVDSDVVRSRIEDLCPILDQIQDNTRSASISIGVLHHGEVIFTRNRGFRDVESEAPADNETNYLLCSLTKAFTAACCGILVDEGKLEWTKPLESYIPFRSVVDPVIGKRATVQDALSHNTGLAHMDLTWLGSGRPWDELLKKRILEPLAMHRTVTNRTKLPDYNVAEPHVVLDDYSLHRQKPVDTAADDTLMGPAGAVWSNVSDMIKWAKALLDAMHHEPSVLKEIPTIVSHKTNITISSISENTYGLGFARAMIPSTELGMLSLNGPHGEYVIGRTSRPRLVLYHNGVALGNSHGLGNGPDWSAQAIAQAMFDFQPPIDFAEVSKQRAKTEYERYALLAADFDYFRNQERSKEKRCNVDLDDYVGNLIMAVNNISSQHHLLTHFSGDNLGFLPSSREEFVVREFIDWFKWDQFILSFHRHEELGTVNGVNWGLQVGVMPVYFERIS